MAARLKDVDPLRVLLRGCKPTGDVRLKRPKPAAGEDDPTVAQSQHTAHPTRLPAQLDFFAQCNTLPVPRPLSKKDGRQQEQPVDQLPANKPEDQENRVATAEQERLSDELLALVDEPHLQNALRRLQITTPTPIQRRAIPRMLAGDSVVAVAPTGSGKTLAYVLPLLTRLLSPLPVTPPAAPPAAPLAAILAPTRELAAQIHRVVMRLMSAGHLRLRVSLLTTKSATAALRTTAASPHLIIATPMRLVAALQRAHVSLSAVADVVLDEADELLSDKFLPQLDEILASARISASTSAAASDARLYLFSATLPPAALALVRTLRPTLTRVAVAAGDYGGTAAVAGVHERISQKFLFVGGRAEQGKVMAVRALLREGLAPPVLVFVQSKERAAELFRELVYDGVHVDAIHSDRTPAARASAVARFRTGAIWLLITTDLLARGLDFLSVNTVINYDMPTSATAYVHRIGRTGRNGRSGAAVTLFTEDDAKVVGAVVKVAKASGADVPDWLLKLGNRVRKDEIRRMQTRPPKRKQVGGPNRPSLANRRGKRKRDDSARGEDTGSDGAAPDGSGSDVEGVEGPTLSNGSGHLDQTFNADTSPDQQQEDARVEAGESAERKRRKKHVGRKKRQNTKSHTTVEH